MGHHCAMSQESISFCHELSLNILKDVITWLNAHQIPPGIRLLRTFCQRNRLRFLIMKDGRNDGLNTQWSTNFIFSKNIPCGSNLEKSKWLAIAIYNL